MKQRAFATERIERGGIAHLAYRVTCATCGAVSYFALKRGGVPRPPSSIVVHFEKEGWFVGASPRKDACPLCRRRERPARSVCEEIAMPVNGKTIQLAATDPPLRADAPRSPNFDEKRLINLKLVECYVDGGYATPWSDQRVAEDLGVPRAWVKEIREGFFGPEGSNPLFDQYLAGCADLIRMQGEIAEERKVTLEMAARLRARCDDFDSKVRDLQTLGKRVEKEIGR